MNYDLITSGAINLRICYFRKCLHTFRGCKAFIQKTGKLIEWRHTFMVSLMLRMWLCFCWLYVICTILVPRPLSNDARFIQFLYRYSHASMRFCGSIGVLNKRDSISKYCNFFYASINGTLTHLLRSNSLQGWCHSLLSLILNIMSS